MNLKRFAIALFLLFFVTRAVFSVQPVNPGNSNNNNENNSPTSTLTETPTPTTDTAVSSNSNNNNNSNNPNNNTNGNKVDICHRTNSVSNPYNKNNVDENAADGVAGNSNGNTPDHFGEHKGPLFDPANPPPPPHNGDQWGDIIPPIVGAHSGLNWTTQGQVVWANNCEYVSSSLTPTLTDTATPTPTQTPGPTATPGGTGGTGGGTGGPSSTTTTINPTTIPARGGGQVLGVSTLAPTGIFATNSLNLLASFGFTLLGFGINRRYGRKKS